jgi:uncharacterized protein (DUF433 family)
MTTSTRERALRGGRDHRNPLPASIGTGGRLRSESPADFVGMRSWERTVRFTRITVDPDQMGGVPCIRGLRIPVATVVGMVADQMTEAEIIEAFPDLQQTDIH